MSATKDSRNFLKASRWEDWIRLERDQAKGLPAPPLQKPWPSLPLEQANALLIELPPIDQLPFGQLSLKEAIAQRRSHRKYSAEPFSLDEVAFLLWATQGVQEVSRDGTSSLRTAPSGGARHTFESYLLLNNVDGLDPGLYRYLPLDHQLGLVYTDSDLPGKVADACAGQKFIQNAAAVFIWTTIPYRMEWRYGRLAYRIIAMDAGHVCQNLYLAAETMGAGACAIAAYHQEQLDALLGVDGENEFTIYVASVGKIA